MKTLLLFTSHFPFEGGETFIENEFPFLSTHFDKIFIVTTSSEKRFTRVLPANTEVVHLAYKSSPKFTLSALTSFWSSAIREELAFVIKRPSLKVRWPVLVDLFVCYSKALEVNSWLKDFVLQKKIDVADLYLYTYWMNNITAGLALYKEGNPLVKAFSRAHGWDVYFERHNNPYLPMRNFMFHRLDACFCISENGQQYMREIQTEKLKNNIVFSPLGTFNPDKITSQLSTDKIVLISCSNLISLKRVHLLIEALAKIDTVNIDWLHFGSGGLMEKIKRQAEELLDSKTNISYELKGQIDNAAILDYYKNNPIDLFINTSETEGLPVSMMEALSYSVPIIATNVGGVSEIVSNNINGFLLPKEVTPEEIASCLVQYFHLPQEEKMRMRNNAQKIWTEKFDADKNYLEFIKTITSL